MQSYRTTHFDPRTKNLLEESSFGRWTVIAFAGYRDSNAYWTCQCSCPKGTTKDLPAYSLLKGQSQSCGCWRDALTSERRTTHGQTGTPEFKAWQQIFVRCYNPKARSFKDYGARGITVCEAWHDSFETFYADMGPRPSPQHSLERRNNDEGYTPANTTWDTKQAQGRNRRSNVLLTHNNTTICLSAWAEQAGMSIQTLRQRLSRGDSLDKILSTPIRRQTATALPKTITYQGVTQSIRAWALHFTIPYLTLRRRLLRGLSFEEAIQAPSND